jgi:hypothetical protein
LHDVLEVLAGDVHGADIGDLSGQLKPVGVHVGDDHVARASMPGHGGGHDADGTGAGDQYILAEEVEAERRVHGIAERVEDGADLVVDAVGERHHVEGGQAEVIGERPLLVHADPPGLGVEVELARAGLAGGLADQVAFARAALAEAEALHVAPHLHDLAREFVAGDKRDGNRALRPSRPIARYGCRCRRCRSS